MRLFQELIPIEAIAEGAFLLPGRALHTAPVLLSGIKQIADCAPFRNMVTPNGHTMSVAMTSCGAYGWITDKLGYRYSKINPVTGKDWPAIPSVFMTLAISAAAEAGFEDFHPNSCLINRYLPKTKLSLHQDKDENDLKAPVVSVSLGLPATFLFGGVKRTDPIKRYRLEHGDVVVWGGAARLNYHGIAPVKAGDHALMGPTRINLTFRKAVQD